jgi:hypothetical protein
MHMALVSPVAVPNGAGGRAPSLHVGAVCSVPVHQFVTSGANLDPGEDQRE